MAARENVAAFGVTIQPTPGTFNPPGVNDLIPISAPDNGSDPITASDPTLLGAIFAAPTIFLGRRGRAGATAALRGPGGSAPPAAGVWPLGRILQAAGFAEVINPTPITATAQTGGSTSQIKFAAGSSAVDDFYNGMPVQHANIGAAGTIRGTTLIRNYVASSLLADLMETMAAAVTGGSYIIPASLTYILTTGLSIPLLSCSVWRDGRRYDYSDCALSSFEIDVPVANDQSTDLPSVKFAMAGIPAGGADVSTPTLPQAFLTPVPPARAGKWAIAGQKLGHQSMNFTMGLTASAPPNQNFDQGQESYQITAATRVVALDINQQLLATINFDTLVDAQTAVPIISGWGGVIGNRFLLGIPDNLLETFNPATRNGFVGVSGNANPSDVDKSVSLSIVY